MNFLSILVIAFLVESIWETLKFTWDKGKVNINTIGALVIGIIVAIFTKLDIFTLVGVEMFNSFVGYILSGILISRGANFVHDLLASITNLKNNAFTKVEVPEIEEK